MRQWNDEHPQTFRDHQPVLQHYCQHADTSNPCQLCTVTFAQYHKCIIWRQLAMLLTDRQLTAEYCDVEASATLVCETCGKVYTPNTGWRSTFRSSTLRNRCFMLLMKKDGQLLLPSVSLTRQFRQTDVKI